MNRYRRKPKRVCDRMFLSCGVYEPLIVYNRVHGAGVHRDGHAPSTTSSPATGTTGSPGGTGCGDGLSWIFPGDQLYVYE